MQGGQVLLSVAECACNFIGTGNANRDGGDWQHQQCEYCMCSAEGGKVRITVILPIWMSRLLEMLPRAVRTASKKDMFCWAVRGMESEDPVMS